MGRRGEDLAHRFLKKAGFTIVARNYRLAAGDAEADLIAIEPRKNEDGGDDGDTVVIVEVKTRMSEEFGPPDRAVDFEKQRALRRVAREYGRKTGTDAARVRCDVVTVVLGARVKIEHFKDAVRVA
jgi:putative endonuclease